MDPLLDRIAEQRALLAGQAQRLAKELAEVEAELERIATAEQVVTRLLAEQDDDRGGDGAAEEAGQDQGRRSPALVVPHRGEAAGVADLPAEYQRLMQVVAEEGAAGQGVACRRAAVKLGLTAEPRHTEGVRVKLKRLVARGWLTESAPGRFTVRP